MLNGRSILVGAIALAVAFAVLRDAFVNSYAGPDPVRAASVWPGHPKVLVSKALTDIGTAAVKQRPPPPDALARIVEAGRLSPMSHDPFLTRGIVAQQAGDTRLAEMVFKAARQRAPREAAPRYFLSQLYVTTGQGEAGLDELATLARLLPNGATGVAPSLAAYARSGGDLVALKAAFRTHPDLEQAVLYELARDPANADLALRLAGNVHARDGKAPAWVSLLLPNLVQAGQFERANRLWSAVSGEETRGTIFNAGFRDLNAPPPFNWTFRSDSAGFAEADGRGGLHVLFYGRDDAVLASQTLLLQPGKYRLTMTVTGNPGGMLRWVLGCLPANREIAAFALGDTARAAPAGAFTIGRDCPAQSLELRGVAGEMVKEADLTISALTLTGGVNDR